MIYGYKPKKFLFWYIDDHRDHDFVKKFGSATIAVMSQEVDIDQKLWMPNQNIFEPIFGNPPLPYGCTDYTQNDMVADYLEKLCNPAYTEGKTQANARGGLDIRVSMASIIKDGVQLKDGTIVKPFKQYLAVKAQGGLDTFDTFKSTLFLSHADRRGITAGLPWFVAFENTQTKELDGSYTIAPLPANWNGVLATPPSFSTSGLGWHNVNIAGYVTHDTKGDLLRGGEQFLKVKSWQGPEYGDNGWCYLSRALVNQIFSIPGTYAAVFTTVAVPGIETIDVSWVKYILSFMYMVANNFVLRPAGLA